MSIDPRKTLEKLKGEADRIRTSLYLSKSLMEEFKNSCEGVAPSRVMEEMMRDFIDRISKEKDSKGPPT